MNSSAAHSPSPKAPDPQAVEGAVAKATGAIAPVWPLDRFVAVNPFLGLADRSFAEGAMAMARAAGARMTMPRSFYAEAIRSGRIATAHLEDALAAAREQAHGHALPSSAEALEAAALGEAEAPLPSPVPTVADVVGGLAGKDWPRFVLDRLAFWAAAYFDQGQASWKSPWRGSPAWQAWKAEASIDRTPEVMGARGFRAAVAGLPASADALIPHAIAALGVPEDVLDVYLHRLLASFGGWSAYARFLGWEAALRGGSDSTLRELLAVRLGCEVALVESFGAQAAWSKAIAEWVADASEAGFHPGLATDLVLQHAYELAWQEQLLGRFAASEGAPEVPGPRPSAQTVFCIDVRSEVMRRALESVDRGVETRGFAGFFGFPVEYVPLGLEHGPAHCPVLLPPAVTIAEGLEGSPADEAVKVGGARVMGRRASNAWKSFKYGAVSCFAFVGPMGLAYARNLVADSLGRGRPVAHPRTDHLHAKSAARLAPSIEPALVGGRPAGLDAGARVAMAAGALRAMSMTGSFARLVLLAGHGSTTVNNPHASGLDCGACGGQSGEASARVAVAVLNDPAVRQGLRDEGIAIPDDTVFVAGLHDTTTDEVSFFDEHLVPRSHAEDLALLRGSLAAAGRVARAERAPALKVAGPRADEAIVARSRDWSQVRPEWGLAGCAAFVAAPRRRTASLDLGGRSFLHCYDWRIDEGFRTLELVMTAPMVVASWINLQYYGSTVDNRAFGSGNKVLHNVVGTLGVLEGNGGDLRTGLAWQSVHDGERFVHEPLRLNVVIEAPIEAMNDVIAKHDGVRALLDNGWLHLWAMGASGAITHRYAGGLDWRALDAAEPLPERLCA